MSPLEKALEENAQQFLRLARSVLTENAELHRENRRLADQLDDALDEVHALRSQLVSTEMTAPGRGAHGG